MHVLETGDSSDRGQGAGILGERHKSGDNIVQFGSRKADQRLLFSLHG